MLQLCHASQGHSSPLSCLPLQFSSSNAELSMNSMESKLDSSFSYSFRALLDIYISRAQELRISAILFKRFAWFTCVFVWMCVCDRTIIIKSNHNKNNTAIIVIMSEVFSLLSMVCICYARCMFSCHSERCIPVPCKYNAIKCSIRSVCTVINDGAQSI